jgi:SAM-dependent methyltransferase
MSGGGWERRYAEGSTPWNLGAPPPALLLLLEALEHPLAFLVPGAGHGHDAVALAAAGHVVTALDIAPSAVRLARETAARARVAVDVRLGDVRHPERDLEARFDAIWEQTCFCALEPEDRGPYVRAMARVLRPGGLYFGLFWNHGRPGGPPYDVTAALARAAFEPCFEILEERPVPSAAPRSRETLFRMRRRDWRPARQAGA